MTYSKISISSSVIKCQSLLPLSSTSLKGEARCVTMTTCRTMGDEGMSTHVLVEHGKVENELEELQLTKSDKSKQRPSRTKAPNQEIKRREQAKRIHVEENQSLDVVKSFAESISANWLHGSYREHD